MQAFIVYYTAVRVLGTAEVTNAVGQDSGLWVAGDAAYGCIVLKANMVLFVKSYIHHGFSIGLFALMLSGYFVFFLIES